MSKLYVASKSFGLPLVEHLYVIYDPDDVVNGNELILRGRVHLSGESKTSDAED